MLQQAVTNHIPFRYVLNVVHQHIVDWLTNTSIKTS